VSDLATMLAAPGLEATAFPPNSRYHGIGTATAATPTGETVTCLRRRFVPAPERLAAIGGHVVRQGDRPDLLAARFLGDPTQLWRLADGNGVIHPADLVLVVGRRLRITLPEGVAGAPRA
jgi:hypothetical protein